MEEKPKKYIFTGSITEIWILANGYLHREDGPAAIHTDSEFYYQHNLLHREDGPAINYINGSKSYYIHGIEIKNFLQCKCCSKIVPNAKPNMLDGSFCCSPKTNENIK